MMMICRRCKQEKPIEVFAARTDGGKVRRRRQCHSCRSEVRSALLKRQKPAPESTRRRHLKYHYGITLEQYEEMLAAQGNSCAICLTHQNDLDRPLSVDHDHSTGDLRGLLCCLCNHGLGSAKDSPEILANMIRYLQNGVNNTKMVGLVKRTPPSLTRGLK